MVNDELYLAVQNAFTKPKYETIATIEKEFSDYLKARNPDFYSFPRPTSLKKLFSLYDQHYFTGNLTKHLSLDLRFTRKLTSSAGVMWWEPLSKEQKATTTPKGKDAARFSFSLPLIFDAYTDDTEGYIVNGIICKNPAEALMRVMEHELTHLVEFILHGNSNCSKPAFQKICFDLFGHTENKHGLGQSILTEEQKHRFRKGDKVTFTYDNTLYTGIIARIVKRATVIVEGEKKFFVPLHLLTSNK